MEPSIGSWSSFGRRASSAPPSNLSSAFVATPTSRLVKNDVTRVTGLRGWLPARSIVRFQSSSRPAALGSSSVVTSPALSATGLLSRGPISSRSFFSASAWLMPPTSTPATVTPRGTLPLEISTSRP